MRAGTAILLAAGLLLVAEAPSFAQDTEAAPSAPVPKSPSGTAPDLGAPSESNQLAPPGLESQEEKSLPFQITPETGAGLGMAWHSWKMQSALKNKNLMSLRKKLSRMLEAYPLSPTVQFNWGVLADVEKDPQAAAGQYQAAADLAAGSQDAEMKYQAHFNAGNAWAQARNVEQALRSYQAALDVRPDSEEVKRNIELLMAGQGGGGGQEGEQESKEGQQNSQQQQSPQPEKPQQKQQQKRKFSNPNLTEQEVRKILDELKRQEENVRAKEFNQKPSKEPGNGKDW